MMLNRRLLGPQKCAVAGREKSGKNRSFPQRHPGLDPGSGNRSDDGSISDAECTRPRLKAGVTRWWIWQGWGLPTQMSIQPRRPPAAPPSPLDRLPQIRFGLPRRNHFRIVCPRCAASLPFCSPPAAGSSSSSR
ncbi:hypothetical protein KKY_695 [Pelagibacterium halotolerans B2]|uniref:Uncharacterized protein n=1 Tax=Pelagibacterium halotolerans (strain DSM 22347 / JCM 15775 / CGMCC 1.7692 / B2) TaxID=1082931 RepID=G4RDA8_PELHB|nr:hypothetical protein KKY_695 [Pelagibacterium halotolerans B2]